MVAEAFDPDAVIAAAVGREQEAKATWSRYDLIRALNTELPDMLGVLGPQRIEQLLDGLVCGGRCQPTSPRRCWLRRQPGRWPGCSIPPPRMVQIWTGCWWTRSTTAV
ncbi:MAG TPA: hypothetical protein VIS06_06440, partial [Mycobacteriales bacterium]